MAEVRDRRSAWAIGILVLLVVFLLLSRCSGGNGSTRVGAVPNSAGPAEPAPSPTSTRGGEGDQQDAQNEQNDQQDESGDDRLTVDGEPLLPLAEADGVGPDGDLSLLSGKQAVARDAPVLSVPADEGFWIGTSSRNRVWVQLIGPPPESPYQVRPGDVVSFDAPITSNGSDFARSVGVTRAEGAATLNAQRQHLRVRMHQVTLIHP